MYHAGKISNNRRVQTDRQPWLELVKDRRFRASSCEDFVIEWPKPSEVKSYLNLNPNIRTNPSPILTNSNVDSS